jgi:tRNA modification GTPase
MVSDIAGTTRDTIEATTNIDGILFRFIDTAGLRQTENKLEQMGIDRTYRAIENAHIIMHVCTAEEPLLEPIDIRNNDQNYILVINKIDKITSSVDKDKYNGGICISAKHNIGINELRQALRNTIDTSSLKAHSVVVSNMRHYAALRSASEALSSARTALDGNLPADLISEDLRQVLHNLGEITGEITSDDILHSIFSTFCIGK